MDYDSLRCLLIGLMVGAVVGLAAAAAQEQTRPALPLLPVDHPRLDLMEMQIGRLNERLAQVEVSPQRKRKGRA